MQTTKATRVLFDATHHRNPSRRFGVGILRSVPNYTAPTTLTDLAWWEAQNALDARFATIAAEEFAAVRRDLGSLA